MKQAFFWTITVLAIGFLLYLNFFRGRGEQIPSVIFSDKAPKPIGPYSQARASGNVLFVSGQIGLDALSGKLDTTGLENETRQVMKNLGAVLKAAGMDYVHVVKSTIYLTDLGDFAKVNEIYGSYFRERPPARETVQVCALPKGAHVEISVIAVKDQ